MDIERALLEIPGVDGLIVHELTKLSLEPSRIEIAIKAQNSNHAEKKFEFFDAELRSMTTDEPDAADPELTWGIIGVNSRALADDRYEFVFRFDDAEMIFGIRLAVKNVSAFAGRILKG